MFLLLDRPIRMCRILVLSILGYLLRLSGIAIYVAVPIVIILSLNGTRFICNIICAITIELYLPIVAELSGTSSTVMRSDHFTLSRAPLPLIRRDFIRSHSLSVLD